MLTKTAKTKLSLVSGLFLICFTVMIACEQKADRIPKAIFIIVDGIPADKIEELDLPVLKEISNEGGFARCLVGGEKGSYNETPTISAVGYNSLLTSTWVHKHNVWDNDIAAPNYHYWNIFRIADNHNPDLQTAIFSTWLDNRTKLAGDGLEKAGNIAIDYHFDGLELDTVRYPHDENAAYISRIDDAVTEEAARYIEGIGPDLSWVYLEFTDDMGHRFGDSPQFDNAIKAADQQIGKIWKAVKSREKSFNEDFLLIITTDHGRDAETGKNHGGQSDREKAGWIVTNSDRLNERFRQTPSMVDIMPSIAHHLHLTIPEEIRKEMDGVSFIGDVVVSDLKAARKNNDIQLQWKSLIANDDLQAEVLVSRSNHFREGGEDDYVKTGEVRVSEEKFTFPADTGFYKILLKVPGQYLNAWVLPAK